MKRLLIRTLGGLVILTVLALVNASIYLPWLAMNPYGAATLALALVIASLFVLVMAFEMLFTGGYEFHG